MSPKKFKKLKELRKSLDILDNSFIKLIKKRTILVNSVLQLKDHKNQIVDNKKKSINNNIDPKITNRIWKNMIWSYIDFERRNFKKK